MAFPAEKETHDGVCKRAKCNCSARVRAQYSITTEECITPWLQEFSKVEPEGQV